MAGRIRALLLLAMALVRALVRRLLRRRSALRTFLDNYAADAVVPVTAQERTQMRGFGRCIGCGMCDRGEAARVKASSGAYPGLMTLVVAGPRSMPDLGAAARGWRVVPEEVLTERELVCPTQVPLRQLSRFVQSKARELEGLARG